MGAGIAQVLAHGGHQVVLKDVDRERLDRALERIRSSLRRVLSREGKDDPETALEEVLARVQTVTNWEPLGQVLFVVEAVFEDLRLKKEVLGRLDRLCPPEAVLASNTSSLPITRLAAATGRPDRVIGMHFMNPVPVMKLVEIVRGAATSDETAGRTEDLARQIKKFPVQVRDFPGFVSNRVLMPMLNEAMFALMEGVAEASAIDEIMKLGMNHPMGPLELADFIGLDVCLNVLNVLYEGFKDPKYRPCPLLQQKVDAGWLGRKAGRGFYDYSES